MRLLLDTAAYSELMRGHPGTAERVREASDLLLSTISVGELLFGFRRGDRYEQNLRELRAFVDNPYVTLLPVTWTTADRFARIAGALRQKGWPIPIHDMWIAAQAMETGADLLSPDEHFGLVEGLAWVRPGS